MSDVSGKSKHRSNLPPPRPHQKRSVVLNLRKEMTASSLGHHETDPPQVVGCTPVTMSAGHEIAPQPRPQTSAKKPRGRRNGKKVPVEAEAVEQDPGVHPASTKASACAAIAKPRGLVSGLVSGFVHGIRTASYDRERQILGLRNQRAYGRILFRSQEGTKQLIRIIRMGTYTESEMLIEIMTPALFAFPPVRVPPDLTGADPYIEHDERRGQEPRGADRKRYAIGRNKFRTCLAPHPGQLIPQKAFGAARFLLLIQQVDFQLNGILEFLQRDPWPVVNDELDLFAGCLYQAGLLELESLPDSANGDIVLSDSFATSIFWQNFLRIFNKDDEDFVEMVFNTTFDIQSEHRRLCTSKWLLRPGKLFSRAPGVLIQIATHYQYSSGQQCLRVMTVARNCAEAGSSSIAASFDQGAAIALMARIAVSKGEIDEEPDFMFHTRRSQFLQVFNNSPDGIDFYRKAEHQDQEGYENFKELLEAPVTDARDVIASHFLANGMFTVLQAASSGVCAAPRTTVKEGPESAGTCGHNLLRASLHKPYHVALDNSRRYADEHWFLLGYLGITSTCSNTSQYSRLPTARWAARASKANPPSLEVKNCGESQRTWLVSRIVGIMTIAIQKHVRFYLETTFQ
ncbi:hypothetical protein EDC04DRAFT_2598008 [Pisolithus marmoratus]|nr:hypothetical protein EDC04DRAFT_2598008 [Pisolithus marmoratus]